MTTTTERPESVARRVFRLHAAQFEFSPEGNHLREGVTYRSHPELCREQPEFVERRDHCDFALRESHTWHFSDGSVIFSPDRHGSGYTLA